MLYYSEVLRRTIHTEDGVAVGKLSDIIFTFTDIAPVTKLLIQTYDKKLMHVPASDIEAFGEEIILKKNFHDEKLTENELYLGRNVIDKQIIDIHGRKVVRVNDAVLQIKNQKSIYITGVDVGLLSVLRWIKLDEFAKSVCAMFGHQLRPRVLSWKNIQPLELEGGKVVLDTHHDKLERFLPEDLADYLEATTIHNAIKTLNLVDREFASEVIAELNLNYQIALFEEFGFEKTVHILELMDPDEAVDVLLQFKSPKQEKILAALPKNVADEFSALIDASETVVGKYMTSEFLVINRNETVEKVLDRIKKETEDFDYLFNVYVVNDKEELVGVTNIHELFFHKPKTPIYKIMHHNPVLAYLNTPIHTVLKRIISYKLYSIPVVSHKNKVLGIVLLDDLDHIILKQL